jgi:galactokinase
MATRTFWAPGRVNLIGEYTDLVGGLVLPVALDLGIRIEAEPAERIGLRSREYGDAVHLEVDGSGSAGAGWGRYVAAVAQELALLGRPPVGLSGVIGSTLPVGAGLSSSAALEVAVAVALCAIAGFELEPMALAQAAQRAEHRAVGVPSGIMDQASAVLGRSGCAVLLDTGSLEHELVELPRGLAIVVVHSGIARTLESTPYALRKRELDQALSGEGASNEVLARRRRHIETENRRVQEVVAALRANDVERLGELFRDGHESLRRDLEVTIPELDRLVELAYRHGAVAARMTGAGFGGAIVALAESERAEAFAHAVAAAYGSQGRAYVCNAADGAGEVIDHQLVELRNDP